MNLNKAYLYGYEDEFLIENLVDVDKDVWVIKTKQYYTVVTQNGSLDRREQHRMLPVELRKQFSTLDEAKASIDRVVGKPSKVDSFQTNQNPKRDDYTLIEVSIDDERLNDY
jgi:hypothetical protein